MPAKLLGIEFAVLRFIQWHLDVYGFSPSLREVAAAVGISVNMAMRTMVLLRATEWIDFLDGAGRTVRLLRRLPAERVGMPFRITGERLSVTDSEI